MNEQLLNKILELSGDVLKNISTLAPNVLNEVINYFIFISLMALIKNLFFLSLVALFYRFVSTQIAFIESAKKEVSKEDQRSLISEITTYRLFRFAGCFLASLTILYTSYPHIETIGKALFAPKIFIIEIGNNLIKNHKEK